MEFRLRPLGFMDFILQNNYHQAVNKKLPFLPALLRPGIVVQVKVNSSGHICLKLICVRMEYLIPYSRKIFVLRIVTRSYTCFLRIFLKYKIGILLTIQPCENYCIR